MTYKLIGTVVAAGLLLSGALFTLERVRPGTLTGQPQPTTRAATTPKPTAAPAATPVQGSGVVVPATPLPGAPSARPDPSTDPGGRLIVDRTGVGQNFWYFTVTNRNQDLAAVGVKVQQVTVYDAKGTPVKVQQMTGDPIPQILPGQTLSWGATVNLPPGDVPARADVRLQPLGWTTLPRYLRGTKVQVDRPQLIGAEPDPWRLEVHSYEVRAVVRGNYGNEWPALTTFLGYDGQGKVVAAARGRIDVMPASTSPSDEWGPPTLAEFRALNGAPPARGEVFVIPDLHLLPIGDSPSLGGSQPNPSGVTCDAGGCTLQPGQ